MPFIKIKSYPLNDGDDRNEMADRLRQIGEDFSQATGIDMAHITVTWEYFLAGHYLHAGRKVVSSRDAQPPILVELLVPDFNSEDKIELMLRSTAKSISAQAGAAQDSIFIHCNLARSGLVYDGGEIVRW